MMTVTLAIFCWALVTSSPLKVWIRRYAPQLLTQALPQMLKVSNSPAALSNSTLLICSSIQKTVRWTVFGASTGFYNSTAPNLSKNPVMPPITVQMLLIQPKLTHNWTARETKAAREIFCDKISGQPRNQPSFMLRTDQRLKIHLHCRKIPKCRS